MPNKLNPQRWLPVEGAYNVRDLGGYETTDGRKTRWQTFLRADDMHRLTERSQDQLIDYGLKTVVDLRRTPQLENAPNVFADSCRVAYLHLNMVGDEPLSQDDEPPDKTSSYAMNRLYGYRRILEQRKDIVRDILTALATPDRLPALFHCSAGTDRTGIVSALLLGLAGVPDETIGHDYALSGEAIFDRYKAEGFPESLEGEEITRENASEFFAPAEGMILVLGYLSDDYGGVESYVRHVGLTDEHVASIREVILE